MIAIKYARCFTAANLAREKFFNPWHYGLLLASLLVIGILHRLVTSSEKKLRDRKNQIIKA